LVRLELILDVLLVTLVENDALGATNEPDIIVELNTGFDSNTVVLVLKLALGAVNDPDIIADVNTAFPSNEVTLVDNEELGAVNDPEMFAAVKLLINTALDPRDPEMPVAVNPTAPPSSRNVTLVLNDELGAVNDPDTADFNANVDKSWSPVFVPDKFDPITVPIDFILLVTPKDPVICADPVINVVPINVWVSDVSSPKIFDPDVFILEAVINDDVRCNTFKLSTVNWFVVVLYSKPSSVPNPPLAVVNTTLPVVINDDVMSVIRDLLLVILEVILDDTDVNDPDIIADVNTGFDSNAVVLEPKLELVSLNAPLISEAICAELDNVPTETVGLFSNDATLVLNDADGAINDPDIIVELNTGFVSNIVVLVLNEADEALNDSEILVAVKLLINVALGPREPEILVELNTGFDSNTVVLVLNDPLSIFKFDILVENEADGATNDPEMLAAICADPDNVPGVTVGLFSSTATLVLKLALGALNDPDIIADVNTSFPSNEVTLVEIDELGAVNDPEIFVAVKLLINSAFVPNEPDIIADVNTSFPSNEATLVLNDPLSVFKLVILELKLELVFVNEPDIFAAVKLLINTALGPRDPDIPEAVNPTAPPPSKNVILLEIEELGDVNDPLIFEAICADPDINVFVVINSLAVILVLNDPLSVFKLVILRPRLDDTDVNDPLIFEAICADPDKVPGAVIFNNVDPSPTNDPLNTEPVTAWVIIIGLPIVIGDNPSSLPNEPVNAFTIPLLLILPDEVILVLTNNPLFWDMDAVAVPDDICDKFNPTILVDGTFVNPLPSPVNEPVNEPVTPPFEREKFILPEPDTIIEPVIDNPLALDTIPGGPVAPSAPAGPGPPVAPTACISTLGLLKGVTVTVLPVLLFVIVSVCVGCDILISLIFLVTDVLILYSCYLFI